MVKKILIIIAGIIVAFLIFLGVTFALAPDSQVGVSPTVASYKGVGKTALTVTVKAELPDGYYWHVNGGDPEVLMLQLKKQNDKVIKIKVKGMDTGNSMFYIYATNEPPEQLITYEKIDETVVKEAVESSTAVYDEKPQETSKIEDGSVEEVDMGGGDEEPDPENLGPIFTTYITVSGEITVNEEKKLSMAGFDLSTNRIPTLLMPDMQYPIYYIVQDNVLYFTIKDADDGWRMHAYDESKFSGVGPFYAANDDIEFSIEPITVGKTELKLSNYMLNYGVQMNLTYEPVTMEVDDGKGGTKEVTNTFLVISDIALQEGKIVSPETEDFYKKIKEITGGDIPLPASGDIKEMESVVTTIGEDGKPVVVVLNPEDESASGGKGKKSPSDIKESKEIIATDGSKQAIITYSRNNIDFQYILTEHEDMTGYMEQQKKLIKGKGYLEGKVTVQSGIYGEYEISRLVVPNSKSITSIDQVEDATRGTYVVSWSEGGWGSAAYAENVTWSDMVAFVADMELKE